MNVVSLTGRLTKDIELKSTQSGATYTRFTLAVNRRVPNQNGEREADFINCVAWNKTAEVMSQYLAKGSQIGITGRIQTDSYKNQHGDNVYTTDIIVEQLDFLESKKNGQSSQQNNQFANDFVVNDDDLPF